MLRVGPVVVIAFVLLSLCGSLPAAEPDTAARPVPTPRQWKILAALDSLSEGEFIDNPLSDVVDYFKAKHEIEIQLDTKALEEAGVSTDTPVVLRLNDITLRSLLRLVLTNLDLTYIVGDGYLFITSKSEAEQKLSTKVYPVQDLVTLDSEFRPLKDGEQAEADFASLIDLIVDTVAPTTWDAVGGAGAIKAFEQSQAIAISQTDEAHEEIAVLLEALRRIRDEQIAAARPVDPFKVEEPTVPAEPLGTKVYHLAPAAAAKPVGRNPAEKSAATITPPDNKLDAWAAAIVQLVPEMIEPESWQPTGKGVIRAVGETVVVQQTDAIQHRVGKLINEILPGSVPPALLAYYPAVRLSMPTIPVRWPATAEPSLGPTEARIIDALDEPCDINVAEEPLFRVIRRLSEQHHVQIHLDERALEESGCGRDTPITRSIKGMSLRTVLKLVLDELDLTYVLRNEVLTITSKTEAENMLTAKIYPVFDLVVRPPGAATNRPGLDFQPLIEDITSTIAPTTWDDVGGPGGIRGFANSAAIVISQTTAVHEEIADFLQALREARAAK